MGFQKGFTVVEFFIIFALLVLLGSVAFVAINPVERKNKTQNSERQNAVNSIIDGFLQSAADHGNVYPAGIVADGTIHLVSESNDASCDELASQTCSSGPTACANFTPLIESGYLTAIPSDPDGQEGYTISVSKDGVTSVESCGSEEGEIIKVSR